MVVMNEMGEMWTLYDDEELRNTFFADGQNVHIDRREMNCVLQKYGIQEESFYLGFGGYRKMPGIGGGGSFVYVDYSGQEEELVIPYWNRDAGLGNGAVNGFLWQKSLQPDYKCTEKTAGAVFR